MISAIAKKKIDRFLYGRRPIGNERISCREFGLTLGTGCVFANRDMYLFVIVKTIIVYPAHRGRGLCRSIFEHLEAKASNVYVERVTSTKLKRILKARKYRSTKGEDGYLAMYKITKEGI